MNTIRIRPGHLDASVLAACASRSARFEFDPSCWHAVDASRAVLQVLLSRHEPIYGINTGFGKLASTRIADVDLAQLQLNLVRSHCTGVGVPLAPAIVRRVLLLKAASLALGASGVRREVIDALMALLDADVLPVMPSQGSVGASGDLAPLAHMSAVLIGEGEAEVDDVRLPGSDALAHAGVAPLTLGPKEGLALLNGTQVSTAIALEALAHAERLFDAALIAGAMTTDAAQGSDTPFDDRIHVARGQRGQREVAARYRALLAGSEIRASHLTCDKVQDPYCLRCQPQVMGACLDQMNHAREVLLIEANGVSDNPLIFAGEGRAQGVALSGGNFHAEPVAFAADNLALVIAEIGALAERRIAMLMDASISGLPPFLVPAGKGGLNSGFMIAQVTAAALASENKALAFPRSVDSLPTSANQEDHVSMATGAALRLLPMLENTTRIVAIELLCAAQGIELRRPLRTSAKLAAAFDSVRAVAQFFANDRVLSGEIAQVASMINAGRFIDR